MSYRLRCGFRGPDPNYVGVSSIRTEHSVEKTLVGHDNSNADQALPRARNRRATYRCVFAGPFVLGGGIAELLRSQFLAAQPKSRGERHLAVQMS